MLLSSLPFVHEFIFDSEYELYAWVPDLGIRDAIFDGNHFLGYSYYDVFLYSISVLFYVFVGALVWASIRKRRGYGTALLLPVLSVGYTICLVFANAKGTAWNDPFYKLLGLLGVSIGLMFWHYRKHQRYVAVHGQNLKSLGASIEKPFGPKSLMLWAALLLLSTFPFIDDMLIDSSKNLRGWVPVLGIERALTLEDGTVLGFNTYRVFLYEFLINLMGFVVWSGCFFDSKGKLYMLFFLVPVVLGFFELLIITMEWKLDAIGYPTWKLGLLLVTGFAAAIFFFVKNRHLKPQGVPQIKKT